MNRLAKGAFGSGRSRLVSKAKSGDPLSIGIVAIYLLFRYAKKRSGQRAYVTKLLPGQTITISNMPKTPEK